MLFAKLSRLSMTYQTNFAELIGPPCSNNVDNNIDDLEANINSNYNTRENSSYGILGFGAFRAFRARLSGGECVVRSTDMECPST